MLPFRFIVHTHDFATQALTDTSDPEALVREALGAEVAYVDYFRPGFPLARAVMDLGPLGAGARGLVLGAARPRGLGRDREGAATTTCIGSSALRKRSWPGAGERAPSPRPFGGDEGGGRRSPQQRRQRAVRASAQAPGGAVAAKGR